MPASEITDKSRRFYERHVAPMIRERFPEAEARIAVGLAGEGSDCFGFDDLISRDHDFGTGVCLWLTDADFERIGCLLSIAYNELADRHGGEALTKRLRERRGVMTVRHFYSQILGADCDTEHAVMTEEHWFSLDHNCLATAVNGVVFRDDLGQFSAFRKLLLNYYPDRVWRWRIANELHDCSAALQVNYSRCMTRGDIVAAELCRLRGLESAMQLFYLLKRVYPPYYKWTWRAMKDLPEGEVFADLIRKLAETPSAPLAWTHTAYDPDRLNTEDPVVVCTEEIAAHLVRLMNELGLIHGSDPYLEIYVDDIIKAAG